MEWNMIQKIYWKSTLTYVLILQPNHFNHNKLKLDKWYGFKNKKIEYLKNGTKVTAQNYTFLFFDGDEIQLLCYSQFLGFNTGQPR